MTNHIPRLAARAGRLLPAALAALALATYTAGALALSPTASITQIRKVVEQSPAGATPAWKAAQVRSMLGSGEHLRTGDDSAAELTYTDGTIFRLAPATTMTMQESENRLLRLILGKIWLRQKRGTGTLRIQTPSVVASISSHEELINVDSSGGTRLVVLETDTDKPVVVQAVDANGNLVGQPLQLTTGQAVEVRPGGEVGPVSNIDPNKERESNKDASNPLFDTGNAALDELVRTDDVVTDRLNDIQQLGGSPTSGGVELEVK